MTRRLLVNAKYLQVHQCFLWYWPARGSLALQTIHRLSPKFFYVFQNPLAILFALRLYLLSGLAQGCLVRGEPSIQETELRDCKVASVSFLGVFVHYLSDYGEIELWGEGMILTVVFRRVRDLKQRRIVVSVWMHNHCQVCKEVFAMLNRKFGKDIMEERLNEVLDMLLEALVHLFVAAWYSLLYEGCKERLEELCHCPKASSFV